MGIFSDLGKGLKNFVTGGGLFGAAASLIGGNRSNKHARAEANKQIALQREFAQNGIRWRVEDAKAAGLHPLYALTGQGAQFSPVSVQDSVGPAIADAGQNLSRSIAATQTRAEQIMQDLAIEQARQNIKLTEAQRMAIDAEEARRRQQVGIVHESQAAPFAELGQASGAAKATTKDATVITPKLDPSVAKGPTPLWRPFQAAPGRVVYLPGGISGDAAEVLESVSESWPMMWMVYTENVKRQGVEWGDWFVNKYVPGGSVFDFAKGRERRRKFRESFNMGTKPHKYDRFMSPNYRKR